eukprot:747810-Hanusia_phi.AAC.5
MYSNTPVSLGIDEVPALVSVPGSQPLSLRLVLQAPHRPREGADVLVSSLDRRLQHLQALEDVGPPRRPRLFHTPAVSLSSPLSTQRFEQLVQQRELPPAH